MKEFRIRENGFREIKKRLIVTMSIIFSVIFLVIILLPALMSDAQDRFNTLPIFLVVFGGISAFSIWNGIRRQRPIFESFVLKIDDEKIVREKLNTPTITIDRADITKITKHANGSFTILGKSKINPILIPSQMEDYPIMESTLNQIREVTVLTSKSFLEKMSIPLSLSGVILMGIIYVSKSQIVVLSCCILIVLLLSASLVLTQLSQNIDKRTKRLSWIVLVPIVAFISIIISTVTE